MTYAACSSYFYMQTKSYFMRMKRVLVLLMISAVCLFLNASSCTEDDKDTPLKLKVTANFTIVPESGTTSTEFLFDASSSVLEGDYETVDHEWYFGDGESKIDGDVTQKHTYDAPGDYTVKLVIKIYKANQSGSAADEIEKTLTVI